MNATLTVLALMACLIVLATLWTYERLLASLRRELDEAIADADLATDLFIAERAEAIERHPSARYGGGNLRVVR